MSIPEQLAVAFPFVVYFLWAWREAGWRIVAGHPSAGPLRRVVITLGRYPSVTVTDRVSLHTPDTVRVWQAGGYSRARHVDLRQSAAAR